MAAFALETSIPLMYYRVQYLSDANYNIKATPKTVCFQSFVDSHRAHTRVQIKPGTFS